MGVLVCSVDVAVMLHLQSKCLGYLPPVSAGTPRRHRVSPGRGGIPRSRWRRLRCRVAGAVGTTPAVTPSLTVFSERGVRDPSGQPRCELFDPPLCGSPESLGAHYDPSIVRSHLMILNDGLGECRRERVLRCLARVRRRFG